MSWRYRVKGRGIALLIHNLWLERGWWSILCSSHFTPWKNSQYGLWRMLGGPQGGSGRRLKISHPPGFEPQTVQPVARHYTYYVMLGAFIFIYNRYLYKLPQRHYTKFQSSMIVCRSVNTISIQAVVFWVVTPCSQACRYQCSSKMSVLMYKTTWCHNKKRHNFPRNCPSLNSDRQWAADDWIHSHKIHYHVTDLIILVA